MIVLSELKQTDTKFNNLNLNLLWETCDPSGMQPFPIISKLKFTLLSIKMSALLPGKEEFTFGEMFELHQLVLAYDWNTTSLALSEGNKPIQV